MKLYKSYMFRTKDPVIDELRTMVQQANKGKLSSAALTKIERDGGPSSGCMAAWFFGKTMRPQSATVEACGRSVGFKRVWVKKSGRGA